LDGFLSVDIFQGLAELGVAFVKYPDLFQSSSVLPLENAHLKKKGHKSKIHTNQMQAEINAKDSNPTSMPRYRWVLTFPSARSLAPLVCSNVFFISFNWAAVTLLAACEEDEEPPLFDLPAGTPGPKELLARGPLTVIPLLFPPIGL
jgi:hypothetical protein